MTTADIVGIIIAVVLVAAFAAGALRIMPAAARCASDAVSVAKPRPRSSTKRPGPPSTVPSARARPRGARA